MYKISIENLTEYGMPESSLHCRPNHAYGQKIVENSQIMLKQTPITEIPEGPAKLHRLN